MLRNYRITEQEKLKAKQQVKLHNVPLRNSY